MPSSLRRVSSVTSLWMVALLLFVVAGCGGWGHRNARYGGRVYPRRVGVSVVVPVRRGYGYGGRGNGGYGGRTHGEDRGHDARDHGGPGAHGGGGGGHGHGGRPRD